MTDTTSRTTIEVGGPSPYDVLVGPGVVTELGELLRGTPAAVVVVASGLDRLADPVTDAVAAAGCRVVQLHVPAGESGKHLPVVERLWDELAAAGITRADALVAVGGGATTDVVGFAAATWLRGVRVFHVPTTLLAMVDAAVGGKTGINTAAGKNLVGAFHPPSAVLVDLDVLATLPRAEWVNGMAEVVKAGFIADPEILRLIESDPDGATRPDGPHARELIERSIAMKARVVSEDLREAGPRESLNYGHTLGHAIERAESYRMPHGHAVSVGLVYAAELGRLSGRLDDATAARHRSVLESVGLPTSYDGNSWKALRDGMSSDKKSRGSRLRFVVLDGLARPGILEQPDEGMLERAYQEVAR
ncbi:MAG TPA: 3-dehydroquinate synthase [Mycobacteriales bacterium]|nr:3-dehydroquinate synthase [Mycobacteriales bacterium]